VVPGVLLEVGAVGGAGEQAVARRNPAARAAQPIHLPRREQLQVFLHARPGVAGPRALLDDPVSRAAHAKLVAEAQSGRAAADDDDVLFDGSGPAV
jgi:hypothetical protein